MIITHESNPQDWQILYERYRYEVFMNDIAKETLRESKSIPAFMEQFEPHRDPWDVFQDKFGIDVLDIDPMEFRIVDKDKYFLFKMSR